MPFTGGGGAIASDGGKVRLNIELLILQSATSCGLTFGRGLRAVQRLRPRRHDGNDAMHLQPNTVPSRTLYKAGRHAGRSDLSAAPLILGHCSCHGSGHPKDEKTDSAKG